MSKYPKLKQLNRVAPIAKRVEFNAKHHGQTLSDPYHWLKDPTYPKVGDEEVLEYLRHENDYYYAFLEPHQEFVDKVFNEFKARTDETETSVPYEYKGYEYRWYFEEGSEYRIRARKNLETGEESVFLNENQLAGAYKYFVLGDWVISADNRYLAYSYDTSGDERYTVAVVDLESGAKQDQVLENTSGDLLFSRDGRQLMYAELEVERWKANKIKVHRLGERQNQDKLVYQEQDDGFFLGFSNTSSEEYTLIVSSQGEVQETRFLSANFDGELQMLVSRDAGFSNSVDHAHDSFYLLANDTHKNFRLVRVPVATPEQSKWQTLVAGSDDSYLMSLQTFDKFLALKTRDLGLEKIHIRRYEGESSNIEFPEDVFAVDLGINPEFKQTHLRLSYESMITPPTVFDYQHQDKTLVTRKVKKITCGYDKNQYQTERLMAPARDGTLVPVSLVYKKGFQQDGGQPLWLYGYGAYAATIEPRFSSARLSALDRGFVYAIAHVRGGAMMGYNWYLDGKLEKRNNTFNDFVDVAQYLVEHNYTSAGNISISGASAGGELMGAAVIQAPQLWRSVNLGVPFVDVLNTMLDASLPLTPPEWKEWGNPIENAAHYALIASYSPYDNIDHRDYPPMFVSGGLNDPRVTYWEPAKWTAKMRHTKTDENLLVMRMNMGAGHFANSGRYGRLKDYAEEYVFMFLAHGINE